MSYKRSALMQSRIEQNKQAIFEAAKTLISQGGFKNAQITAIAELAGVSNGLVYRYFTNKSQLMIHVLNHVADTEIMILNAIASSDLSVQDKLHRATRVFVKRALNAPQMAHALMIEPVDDAQFEQARFLVKRNIARPIEHILDEGKRAGVFLINDIKIGALCIVGAMTFSVVEPLNDSQHDLSDEVYRTYFSQEVADFCVSSAKVVMT